MHRRSLIAALAVVLAGSGGGLGLFSGAFEDEDRPVDPTRPDARAAAQSALSVVPGRVDAVTFDVDDDKWEIIISQHGTEYEVELSPQDYSLLRLDYD